MGKNCIIDLYFVLLFKNLSYYFILQPPGLEMKTTIKTIK